MTDDVDEATHLTTVQSIGTGSDYLRCVTCGREAVNVDEFEHHDDCPHATHTEGEQ